MDQGAKFAAFIYQNQKNTARKSTWKPEKAKVEINLQKRCTINVEV